MRIAATVKYEINIDTEVPEGWSTDRASLIDFCQEAAVDKLLASGPDLEEVEDIEVYEDETDD